MDLDPKLIDWVSLTPELILLTTTFVVLLTEPFLPRNKVWIVNPISIIGVLGSLAAVIGLAIDGTDRRSFGNMFVVDNYALLFKGFFLAGGLLILLLSWRYFQEIRTYQGEYYFLLLSSYVGMLLMPSARDLVMVFIALEIVSVPGFVMAGLRKFDLKSNEGALKFFLFGVLSVAVLLFGASIVYGFTGTTDLVLLGERLGAFAGDPMVLAALLFVIVGFGFKISAVPFHFWAPDTYEGAPLPVTAFLSVLSKAAGMAGLLQVCFIAFEPLADVWAPILAIIAIVTMTLGNLTAMQQSNIVRLLAYSSVSTGGFILVPFGIVQTGAADINSQAFSAVMVYLLVYSVMNIGAFAVVTAVARTRPGKQISDFAGLGLTQPGLAVPLTLFLVALTGIPPLVGWYAKFVILLAVAQPLNAIGVVLAAAIVVNSVIGAFYYLRVARTMWMDAPPEGVERVRPGAPLWVAIGGLAVAAVVLGLLPQAFAGFAEMSTLVAAGS
ncbi:NADH-quinone oxidoreductase subunit N [Euzebya pacifica]|jgi:NADH-quinone oxidoreductase subunit N|uniref:NADH-quinone oxidoreductase subunit N n=1 Tax=Euzebya pacifica TaxID=1608957 RepID=UPI0030FCF5A2